VLVVRSADAAQGAMLALIGKVGDSMARGRRIELRLRVR